MRLTGKSRRGVRERRSAIRVARYDGREELPSLQRKYDDGVVRYYASGTAEFETSNGSIVARMRWTLVDGVVRWVISDLIRERIVMAIRKLVQAIDTVKARGVAVPEATDYPLMMEYLTHDKYDDGSARQTSVIIVTCTGDSWRVCLTDKDQQRVMWKQGQTLQDALQAVELALMSDDPGEWRKSAESTPRRKK